MTFICKFETNFVTLSKKLKDMNMEEYNAIRPSYYNDSDISCIDAMVSAFGRKEVASFCKINAIKYVWRLGHKDEEAQEIGKIKWYLDKYLELTQSPIGGVLLDTGEPFSKKPIVIKDEKTILSELKQKGLTDREAENITNKN